MEVDNVASAAAAPAAATTSTPLVSRRVPLCSYAPPSLAGAPTALLRSGMTVLGSAAEKMGDWGGGFGGWLVASPDDEGEGGDDRDARRRRRGAAAEASSSSSPSDLSFPGTLPLPTAQRQSTHELAGHGLRSAVAARDAAFYAEYSLFLSEAKGKSCSATGATAAAAAAATAATAALLTRESVVAGRRVPLSKLFRVVQRLGGYARVAEGKRAWRDVLRSFEVRFFFFSKREREREKKKKPTILAAMKEERGGTPQGGRLSEGRARPREENRTFCSGGDKKKPFKKLSRLPRGPRRLTQKGQRRAPKSSSFFFPLVFFVPPLPHSLSFTPPTTTLLLLQNRSRTRKTETRSTPCARSG